MKRQGFTLVELSIVLVIIGLLISGVLVGQSMIRSTKIQAQVKQFQQFDIAVENFKEMYGQLPGDSTYFPMTEGCASGDNDGTLEDGNDDAGETVDTFDCEISGFWPHLSQNGFGSKLFVEDPDSGGDVVPELRAGNGVVVAYGVAGKNFYQAFDGYRVPGQLADLMGFNYPAFLGSTALALDSKMDDGSADTGSVIALGSEDGFIEAASAAAAGSEGCLVTGSLGSYNVSYNATEACQLRIDILSQTSNQ